MSRRSLVVPGFVGLVASFLAAAVASGCSAGRSGTNNQAGSGPSGGGGSGGTTATTSATAGEGGGFDFDGGSDANNDAMVNPCGTECGPKDLCDPDHLGKDDNCDGQVDETCDCGAGEAHSCFKGDPSYVGSPGCFAGTMKCSENGLWGPCIGGVHATDDQKCFVNDTSSCHPISAVPFQDVNLKVGTGSFSADAVPGSEVWTVTCPPGVSPCPTPFGTNPKDDFKPLQSGEYSVTYVKGAPGGGTASCTYPLFVGAPGLRVELSWEHDLGGTGVDLDLHLHQPANTKPWSFDGQPHDCSWSNCTIETFKLNFGGPDWFSGTMPPAPVDWYLDPTFERNTCYFAPRGQGEEWQTLGKGCHNPRLDLDNLKCDPLVLDVNDDAFCAPENVNVDFPPTGNWFRIGVHYFSNNGLGYEVHPAVKVFCEGALAAELGPAGFNTPEAPVTFGPAEGTGVGGNRFWMVADVGFTPGKCGTKSCVVKPLYVDASAKTPLFTVDVAAAVGFGPPYPPAP